MSGEVLWRPDEATLERAHATRFRRLLAERHGVALPDPHALHAWSVEHREAFWRTFADYADVRAETLGERVLENDRMPGARWFPEARLNFAANLLGRHGGDGTRAAVLFRGEGGGIRTLSHDELASAVARLAAFLRREGVATGDRVAGFLPNVPEAVIAMLATSAIGATWSSCSPDFGIEGVHDRFGQIRPKVLLTADGYRYAGRVHDSLATVDALVERLEGLARLIVVPFAGHSRPTGRAAEIAISWDEALGSAAPGRAGSGGATRAGPADGEGSGTEADDDAPSDGGVEGGAARADAEPALDAVMLPFDHPLYILYSSGTTGRPKCIVHGAGGTLLQHLKEHLLHADVHAGDRVFFFTTCGWMMWNWLVSGLGAGATIALYDGSPFHPDGKVLFDYAEAAGFTHFGTSAKFIDACAKSGVAPARTHALPALRNVMSTGSPLVPESFDYVYESVAPDACLSSMSGGTDIVSCFALGSAVLPVRRGELQSLGLGMDVRAFDDAGRPLPPGEKGELVCTRAFPSMPTGFLDDADGARYRAAYFERFPGVWCHGDFVSLTESGGMIIHGRSDAVLNPGGVRIGTAEIYRPVETFDEVIESIVIGQRQGGDVRVVLFVRLREGLALDEALETRIRARVRERATPRHVPARIVQVEDIPRTRSGKIVELAVARVVHGEAVDNVEALANPEALEHFRDRAELAD